VSHHVKQLEEFLGVALFRRLTRALELTPEANAMLPKVREGLENLVEALERVRRRGSTQPLVVVTPPNFAARWLVPRLARFTNAHPEVELHLASRAGMIDGRELDTRDSHADAPVAMVRFGSGRYPGRHVDEVFAVRYVPVCSPRLLKGPHALKEPEDLRFHTLLHDDTVTEGGARPSWADWLESAGVRDVDASRGPRFSDASLALEAAIEGMGVTLAIKALTRAEIESGRLVVPFDITEPAAYAYYLVTTESDAAQPQVQAFRQWLLEEAAPELAGD